MSEHTPSRFHFLQYTLVLSISLLLVVCFFSKTDSFIGANVYHCELFDGIFSLFTHIGDGICALLLVVIFFILKIRSIAVKLFLTFTLSGIIAQILKKVFEAPRPKTFFADNFYDHFIEGVTNTGYNSFPSGHTTTVFGVAAILSFSYHRPAIGISVFIIAVLVGYSRIYLGQHFVEDVLAGMITGISVAFFVEKGYMVYLKKGKSGRKSQPGLYKQTTIEL